jgi:hypothetical protein
MTFDKLVEDVLEGAEKPNEFVRSVKRNYGHLNPQFGIENQGEHAGKMFAIMPVSYDEGDRREYDTLVIVDGVGQSEGYSDQEVKRLYSLVKKV